jgi:hypothetical protein
MQGCFPRHIFSRFVCFALFTLCFAISGASIVRGQAQSNAADLRGFVRDPAGAVVTGATVTARNPAINIERTATTNDEGFYQLISLPPGTYEVTVEATNFRRSVIPTVQLTVGQRADLDIALEVGEVGETVTVTGATTELVETSRTAVANTIDQQRIDNLPINERSYLNFALTVSTVTRDNGRPIGPAPTSGLNFGGQRGRSNLIQVDGADNTDNSVNAARSTVSQEAVQEFQVVTNSFAPEFGRSSGGIVNVVTRGGTNNIRGNIFGFLRDRRFQANNAFAPIDEAPFTRTQFGATIGGPFATDRTFFFAAFERRQRRESGFFTSDVGRGLTGSVTIGAPFLPFTQTFTSITPQQASYVNGLLQAAQAAFGGGNAALGNQLAGAAIQYATIASSGGQTALTGTNTLRSPGGAIPAGAVIGSRFFLSGAPVPVSDIAFRPLNSLLRIFPVTDNTTFTSFRLDHRITDDHQFTARFGYNPSEITGIQVESQNQSLGQNDFSRTGIQNLRDAQFVATLNSTLSSNVLNEARFQAAVRRASFTSQNPNAVAFNISGTAFIGRELFSPVFRTERRFQFTDNINVIAGNHTLKFGADVNDVDVDATFELNFAGLFNFGGLSANTLAAFPTLPGVGAAPDFTPVQQYGIGFPSNFIQGFGNPNSSYSNRPLAFFAQDSWKIRPNLTLNYGVRYDVELTQQIAPVGFTDTLTGITLSADQVRAAQDVLGVQQGIPRDYNNIAPRVGVAWDVTNDGRTVIRAAYGIFYDHPLLAIAFNSDIADAAQQNQGVFLPGSPSPLASFNAVQIFQGTLIPCSFAGANPGVNCTPGLAGSAEYQAGRQRFNDQTFPGLGPVLPFSLPIAQDFEYAYANQGNLTIERQLTTNMSVSASYLYVRARNLPRPIDINAPRTDLQIENFRRYANRAPTSTTEALLVTAGLFPTTASGSTFANPLTGETFAVIVPGMIVQGPRGRVINPAIANFFRPNAPNYFLALAASRGQVTPAVLDAQLAGTLRTPGVISPFGSVNAQVSNGSSEYNAGTFELRRRFADNYQFLASYTFSKAIDDSSDLQTLLLPQDNRNLEAERALSLFDQRHRFVFSGVLAAPPSFRNSDSLFKRFLADFIVAPIFEISSGRPFNILTNQDTNNDQSNQTDRPSVGADGVLIVPGPFQSGNLGRNRGVTRSFMQLDLRVTRNIRFGERFRLELIAEGFNLFNRFNQAAASPFFDDVNAFGQRASDGRYFSRATAAFDPRQFQFGLKLNF